MHVIITNKAIKKYILKLLAFFIPLAFFLFVFLYYAKTKHEFLPSSWYYAKEFNTAFKQKDRQVLALGNSKVLSAIDKAVLEDNKQHAVALLGYSSANISISKLTLESYLNTCKVKPNVGFFRSFLVYI